jgi:hypothetical protein
MPVSLVSGRHDSNHEAMMQPWFISWFDSVLMVKWVIMANSANFPHLEEKEKYVQVIISFLNSSS